MNFTELHHVKEVRLVVLKVRSGVLLHVAPGVSEFRFGVLIQRVLI